MSNSVTRLGAIFLKAVGASSLCTLVATNAFNIRDNLANLDVERVCKFDVAAPRKDPSDIHLQIVGTHQLLRFMDDTVLLSVSRDELQLHDQDNDNLSGIGWVNIRAFKNAGPLGVITYNPEKGYCKGTVFTDSGDLDVRARVPSF